MTTPRLVACPTCGQRHPYRTDNPARPFCSERCKLIDLGAWAQERYRVPVVAPLDPDADLPFDSHPSY